MTDLPPGFRDAGEFIDELKRSMGFAERVCYELTRLRLRVALYWSRRRR